ncbi:RAMP superfamily CRISPR-associated protein [Mitsuokella jalaludinii]|uniref:RAMP superfamily CRISPR-associated protein n=1 Tax=Mitsuokella jalaludinii TaxID=187979 RepID=UPI002A914E85|nr:RAMP superfamily CRISPR-associated protein [Mitsuokella jalaludinii]MCI6606693.1 RAMP superfamily CRISPR-associated protein [Mitsuokella jalaludinii]MCI7185956.1 RAMP superfamily CRISPR-associated protein [Mitsuokella jalaludinii]MDY5363880.1 RAMP superfamily CRISPR-associated protein [Mitsuokella jalaludinii]
MKQESIAAKIVAEGELVLDAPLLIGSGGGAEGEDDKDIHVLRNKEGMPYIPGTSLAGVLRAFVEADDPEAGALIFGTPQDRYSNAALELQSAISIYDVKLSNARTIVRDGVSIDGVTGVAVEHHKFDYEAIDSGAHGILQLEITLRGIHAAEQENLDAAMERLRGRLLGGFYLGAHTTKGFGRAHMSNLTVNRYDFRQPKDVLSWLSPERKEASCHEQYEGNTEQRVYAAEDFVIDADFALAHSLIIRDYDKATRDAQSSGDTSISAVMKTDSRGRYIIPGTSLKGVLRHRSAYILQQLGAAVLPSEAWQLGREEALVEYTMGPSPETMKLRPNEAKRRSRFLVDEAVITQGVIAKEQSRNRIDRFTGGTIDTALFTTKPIWQKKREEPVVRLHFGVKAAESWEAGLALLLLKDLWLGRTAIGGEKSIGRGTLKGVRATISYDGKKWEISNEKKTDARHAEALQQFVTALVQKIKEAAE